MHEVEPAVWSLAERDLRRRIEAHPFEREDHALDFTKRLARDRGWSLPFARGAVAEYRRFCFLAMVFDTPVTPSEEVDEVWHQHLTYSRDYWERWCGQVLGSPLHHDPTAGGPAEQARYRAQYAETLACYEAYFGPPDPAYWPGTAQRFRGRPRYRIVDGDRVLLLPRPNLRLGLRGWFGRAAGALVLLSVLAPEPAQALPLNPLDWPAVSFVPLYFALAAVAWFVADLRVRLRMRDFGAGRPADDLGLIEIAMLDGGRQRAADAIVIGWLQAGAARIERPPTRWFGREPVRIEVDAAEARMPAEWEPYRTAARGLMTRHEWVERLSARLGGVEAELVRRDLLPTPEVARRLGIEAVFVFGPVILLGLTEILVGLSRGKPIALLVVLTIVLVGICAGYVTKPPPRTGGGEATLASYRHRFRRAAEAPQEHELLFAFALGGAALLVGTQLAEYGELIQAGSGDGGGGCGGGCGGCGG